MFGPTHLVRIISFILDSRLSKYNFNTVEKVSVSFYLCKDIFHQMSIQNISKSNL